MCAFVVAIILLNVFYVALFWQLLRGWNKLPDYPENHSGEDITVIIPFRNEENRIQPLLLSILSMHDAHKANWLFVDDHSSDKTVDLIGEVLSDSVSYRIIECPETALGKRKALMHGIRESDSEVIMTTDADCQLPERWLVSMMQPFGQNDVQCVTGPVMFHPGPGFKQAWFQLEFISLIGIGASAIGLGAAFLGNGANLAYRRSAFTASAHLQTHLSEPGGDDVRTISAIQSIYGKKSIAFCKEPQALVRTEAPASWSEFIKQRKRWSSKNAGLSGTSSVLGIAVLYNALLASLLIASLISPIWWKWLVLSFIIKSGMEGLFLLNVLPFFDRLTLIRVLFPGQVIHIPYVLLGAVWSVRKKFQWKGRLWKP